MRYEEIFVRLQLLGDAFVELLAYPARPLHSLGFPARQADLPNFGHISTLPLFRATNRRGSETLDASGGPTGLAQSNGGRNVIGARRANPASPAGAPLTGDERST